MSKRLVRRIEALKSVINDQFFSMIKFCTELPYGGDELMEHMLRELAILHTRNSFVSNLYLETHKPPKENLSPKEAIEFVIDIHVKERLMRPD